MTVTADIGDGISIKVCDSVGPVGLQISHAHLISTADVSDIHVGSHLEAPWAQAIMLTIHSMRKSDAPYH